MYEDIEDPGISPAQLNEFIEKFMDKYSWRMQRQTSFKDSSIGDWRDERRTHQTACSGNLRSYSP